MLFLHSHGVSTGRAVRIFKTYGNLAIQTVRENPFTLAKEIRGIGFATADQIAQSAGVANLSSSSHGGLFGSNTYRLAGHIQQ